MGVTINISGSNSGSFSLGKNGPTFYSGPSKPNVNNPQTGDVYFLMTPTPQILLYDGTTWQVPTGKELIILAQQLAIAQNNIQGEISRATNSENSLSNSISSLQASLNSEIARAKSVESDLQRASLILHTNMSGYLPLSGGTLNNLTMKRSIIGPNGGFVPEIINYPQAPVMQSFTAKGTSNNYGTFVLFPTAFRTIPQVFIQIDVEEQNSANIPRFASLTMDYTNANPAITTTGFYFQPVYDYNGSGTSGYPWTLQVLAIGNM